MADEIINKVSIRIGPRMYNRFEDFPNTIPHVLAEFIDNALQSFRDKKTELEALEPGFRPTVTIDILWDEDEPKLMSRRATKFIIDDNAGGIMASRFINAFEPSNEPDDRSGLNEFGMGLKTAGCWLGNKWIVRTKALGEGYERVVRFDQAVVTKELLEEADVENIPADRNAHYTHVEIEQSTKNVPTFRSFEKIKTELASIYRNSLRSGEMSIVVNGERLSFDEYVVLHAPYVKNPSSPALTWRRDIHFKFGQYKADGFIAILKDIDSSKNGLVLSRRGRVIVGAEHESRVFPKVLFGASPSTFRYKRLFGELDLEGFDVTFNKNDFLNKDDLEVLFDSLAKELKAKEGDFFVQADDYRREDRVNMARKFVAKHDKSPKAKRTPVVIDTEEVEEKSKSAAERITTAPAPAEEPKVLFKYDQPDYYQIDGKSHYLKVVFVEDGDDLFWLSAPEDNPDDIICKVNANHAFFDHFDVKSNPAIIALIKTLAVSQYTTIIKNKDTATNLIQYFNDYIKKTKV